MKKFSKVAIIFFIVVLSLVLASIALAGKPQPVVSKSNPGYIMFNDVDPDVDHPYVIKSDGLEAYADCSLGGTDQVEINIWNDGSFRHLVFYPGVMYKPFYKCGAGTFSSRRVKFNFNVSGIVGSQPTGNAVRDILRWYSDESPQERCTANPGYIIDGLHTPIMVNCNYSYLTSDDFIQFGIDPTPESDPPGSNVMAVTQDSVNSFYAPIEDNITYWCTRTEPDYEPAPYVIYTIDYGSDGFDVQAVQWDKRTRKPVTWIVKTKERTDPVRLFVVKNNELGVKVYLANYPSLPFEFAVSLKPITSYPVTGQAPPRINTISTTWGEIKGE